MGALALSPPMASPVHAASLGHSRPPLPVRFTWGRLGPAGLQQHSSCGGAARGACGGALEGQAGPGAGRAGLRAPTPRFLGQKPGGAVAEGGGFVEGRAVG